MPKDCQGRELPPIGAIGRTKFTGSLVEVIGHSLSKKKKRWLFRVQYLEYSGKQNQCLFMSADSVTLLPKEEMLLVMLAYP